MTVRCHVHDGLFVSGAAQVRWNVSGNIVARTHVKAQVIPLVYDVPASAVGENPTGDWREVEQQYRNYADIDYSQSSSSLAAAWPTLHYPSFNWSVSVLKQYLPCGHMSAVSCGTAIGTTLRLTNVTLLHGWRYHVCISSHAILVQHKHHNESLPAVEHCTDGVTIDTSPPTSGCVWAGPAVNTKPDCQQKLQEVVQASTSELHVAWQHFTDVEAKKAAVHLSAIGRYEIGVGKKFSANGGPF